VIVDEKGIKVLWKGYMEKLMNKENEGPSDCIRINEVAAALKR